ncbi:MAG: SRPBCC family protein [Fibrobacteria bacterium]
MNTAKPTAQRINIETTVKAPLAEVWRAYSSPEDIKKWNSPSPDWHTPSSTVDLREGGAFSSRMEAKDGSMGFDFAGTYTKVVDRKLIEYAFGDRTARIEFSEGKNGVIVKIGFDAETEHPVDVQRAGWQSILDSFKKHVESSAEVN